MKKRKILPMTAAVLLALGSVRALAAGEMLVPGGQTVGIELRCDGVMVSGLAEISTEEGGVCPAEEAGVRAGDRIIELNGQPVHTAEEFVARTEALDGGAVTLRAVREGRELELTVEPRENREGRRQLGLWLRDSIRGIGTVTFYDPATGAYGALGHGVSLPESRELLPAGGGTITAARVVDVVPGKQGEPGELCGMPEPGLILGTVEQNTPRGIFGTMTGMAADGDALPVAADAEIRTGKASILTTVDDGGPREYQVEILRLETSETGGRQFTLRVTDPELLAVTGGIVQGMSGSPVLQNGRLVGAVTHVLVQDPGKGYGVTMENMLSAARTENAAA